MLSNREAIKAIREARPEALPHPTLNDDILRTPFTKRAFRIAAISRCPTPNARKCSEPRYRNRDDHVGAFGEGELPRCLTGRGPGLVVETGESVDSGWKNNNWHRGRVLCEGGRLIESVVVVGGGWLFGEYGVWTASWIMQGGFERCRLGCLGLSLVELFALSKLLDGPYRLPR